MFTGSWEWLIIFAVLLLLFGGSKLPKLGGALGEGIKNFKKGVGDDQDQDKKATDGDIDAVHQLNSSSAQDGSGSVANINVQTKPTASSKKDFK